MFLYISIEIYYIFFFPSSLSPPLDKHIMHNKNATSITITIVAVNIYLGANIAHTIKCRLANNTNAIFTNNKNALPGLVVWTPSWFLIRRAERNLLAKGPRWNDSVAEMKMLYGFLSTIALFVLSAIFVNWKVIIE